MKRFTGILLVLFFLPLAEAAEVDILKIRAQLDTDGITTIKILVKHPMETGTRTDKRTGELIPAHYLTNISATWNGTQVFRGVLSSTISKNPFLAFKFNGAAEGDAIKVSWEDNLGHSDSQPALISCAVATC